MSSPPSSPEPEFDSTAPPPLGLGRWDRPGLLLLMLCVKGFFLLILADVFYYGEEMEKGAAARLLLAGAELPYHEFSYHHYEGGGFVCIHLKALAFLLVGPTILAHKWVALAWLAGILWVAMGLLGRHFGRNAALLGGALLLLGPPAFQKLSLLNLGIHYEACLFLLIVFDRGLRIMRCQGAPQSRDLWILGLASGFGIFYSYQLAIAVGYVGLVLLLRKPRVVFAKPGLQGLAGMLLGLLPLAFMYSRVGDGVFFIHGTELTAEGGAWGKVGEFFSSVYAQPGLFAWVLPASLLSACVPLATGSLGSLRPSALFLAGFLALWLVVYLNSAFVVGTVYHDFSLMRLAPALVVGTLFVAATLGVWMDGGGARRRTYGRVLAAVLLGSGVLGAVEVARDGHVAEPGAHVATLTRLHGYDYDGYLSKLWPRMEQPVEERLRWILAADVDDARELRAALARVAGAASGLGYEQLCALFEAVDPGHLADYHLGLGNFAVQRTGGDLARALQAASALPAPLNVAMAEGIGRWGKGFSSRFPEHFESEMSTVPASTPGRAHYLRGVAWRAWQRFVSGPFGGGRFALEPERVREWLRAADVVGEAELLIGWEQARAHHLRR